ncbi:restriction endonuclease subunit S [Shewanella gelidimarina]|uniref:restriction endonuclease subunit S n=1 Tax=Shewanella gelidimarina TaxID=56813 RepID=UPI00201067BF|nr:restriction endonuclease subunit S [Shewanella gelidimarina]MCL1058684.1 restriction endonuclease subunit S [Shewanella gelidimarina]
MANKWKSERLGELCEEITVGFVGSMTHEYVHAGIPFLRSKNIREYEVDWNDMKFVSPEFHKKLSKSNLKPGDVAIVRTGKPGTTCVIPDGLAEANCSDIVIARVNNDVLCAHYLSYFMNALAYGQVNAHIVGAVQQHFNVGSAKKLEVPLPPRSIQAKIVEILKAIDDKRRLNQQTNQTLEKMAQTLFKSWFVEFDPVFDNLLAKHDFKLENLPSDFPDVLLPKAAARLKALCTQQGTDDLLSPALTAPALNKELNKKLNDAIHPHFPSEFEHNEQLGWIPKGWESGISGKLIDVRDGTHDSPKKSDEGFPLVTSKHITSGDLDLSSSYLISKIDFEKVNARSKVDTGDILLTMIGTVGIPYLVVDSPVDYAIKNVGLFKTSASMSLKNYFYLLLKSPLMQNYLNARMAGTTQKYLSLKVLRSIDFLLPSEPVLREFDKVLDSLTLKSKSNLDQNKSLTKIRDTLLPKLISGELQIPDAEDLLKGEG